MAPVVRPQYEKNFVNKEISWLAFNDRVLQEAADSSVPLIERLKFLGIFSSNLDEFFRVRVATLKRLTRMRKKAQRIIGHDPQEVLEHIQETVLNQRSKFEDLYFTITAELRHEQIYITDGNDLSPSQQAYAHQFFEDHIRPILVPVLLDTRRPFPILKDHSIYLAVRMVSAASSAAEDYALIEIPTQQCSRFILLPDNGKEKYLILLDDVIRLCLPNVFAFFDYQHYAAYTIKITRDAELDLDDEFAKSYIQQLEESLQRRREGQPVRFVYDREIPDNMLAYFKRRMQLTKSDAIIPGFRYHNFKDFTKFPNIGREEHYYPKFAPLDHPVLASHKSTLAVMQQQDVLLHFPYQSFTHFLELLREAAMDPQVTSIKLTVYRVAKRSAVLNALINAARNDKKVHAVVELQARFDEAANLEWSRVLREEGVKVTHGVQGLKVHGKLCLIQRKEKNGRLKSYCCIGTGNFNEDTAGLYTDHLLLTTDRKLCNEVIKVFDFMDATYRLPNFRHLIVAPFQMRSKLKTLVRNEIRAAQNGEPAYILLKINNFADQEMTRLLYQANEAGVEMRFIARSMFSVVPGEEGLSENIEAFGLIDRFLEHSRIYIFGNRGRPKYFLSSGDWLPRNFDRRIEVTVPIYAEALQQELQDYFDIQWQENVKARMWNRQLDSRYRPKPADAPHIRSQKEIYRYLHSGISAALEEE